MPTLTRRARLALIAALAVAGTTLTGCSNDASVVSENLSQEADQFRVARRVVFYNGITDKYLLTIEGNCSLSPRDRQVDVICKLPAGGFVKQTLGLSDNVTWFSQQLTGVEVSTMQYAVIFKPESLIPDIDRPQGAKDSPPADLPAPR